MKRAFALSLVMFSAFFAACNDDSITITSAAPPNPYSPQTQSGDVAPTTITTNFPPTQTTVVTNFAGLVGVGVSLAFQPDGKSILTGYAYKTSPTVDSVFALARYNDDGSDDTTFGTGGKVTTPLPGAGSSIAAGSIIQSSGKIVAAGYFYAVNATASRSIALVRYNSDGSMDSAFGTSGMTITQVPGASQAYDTWSSAMAQQADGKLLVIGAIYRGGNVYDFAVFRYSADGAPDLTFGNGLGYVTTNVGYNNTTGNGYRSIAHALAVQSDGKIILIGDSAVVASPFNTDFAIVRYNTDGSLDSGFGTGGLVVTQVSAFSANANAVALQGDGSIVVAGTQYTGGGNCNFVFVRYATDGSLDLSIGSGTGMVTTNMGDQNRASAVAIQGDGKIVLAGYTYSNSALTDTLNVVRYQADGTLDTGFGTNGISSVSIGQGFTGTTGLGIAIPNSSTIAVGGYSFATGTADFALSAFPE